MGEKKRSRAIIVNTISNYLHQILQVCIFLLLTPFIAKRLGTDGYGLWSLIQATAGILGLLDLGFSTSVVKYIADARGKEDQTRLTSLVATFFWIYTFLSFIALGLAIGFALVLPDVLHIPADKAETARIVFILIAVRTAIGFPLGMFRGVMTGFQKQWWANFFKMLATLLYGLGSAFALIYYPSVENLAIASFISHTVALLAGAWLCLSNLTGVSIHPRFFRKDLIAEVTSFSIYFFMIQISSLIYTRIDAIIIQSYLSLSFVAMYNVAAHAAEHSSGLCRQLTNALTPVIAELRGAGDEKNIRAVFRVGTKMSTAMAAPILIGLFFLAEETLVAWMGEEFRGAVPACRLLLVASIVSVIHGNAANVLSMSGHQRFLATVFFGGQILNLGLTIWLVQKHGLWGVAFATLISSCLVDVFLVQRRACRETGMSMMSFYWQTVGPSIIPSAMMCLFQYLLVKRFVIDSLPEVAMVEAVGCLVFFVAFYAIGLSTHEKHYLISRLTGAKLATVDATEKSN